MKHYLGIDLGGTNAAMGILDERYHVIAKKSIQTLAKRGFSDIVKDIALTAKSFAVEHQLEGLGYVGIGVPGTIDPATGTIIFANNLGWVNVDFIAEFQSHWDIPIKMSNDANCAVLGEAKAGCGVGHKDLTMLTLGTGVGGGIILDHHPYLGCNGLGCELGHTVFIYDGLQCNCGRKGCLEMYLSVTAFKRQTKEAMEQYPDSIMHQLVRSNFDKISGKTAFQAKKLGDEAGTQVVDTYISYIAAGIVSLFSIFRSPLIIIGGGISNEGAPLLDPIQEKVSDIIKQTDFMEPPTIVKAQLGGDAGIIGAALLGCES